jgi:tRNA threonylcarbamoyladenosine biosynthesis protein TsaE
MLKLTSNSPEETKKIAYELAQKLKPGDVICVYGDLGAGKTVFASALAQQLGITQSITSPTFTIVNEYEGRIPFYHFDVYRIDTKGFLDIGGDEYFYKDGIVLIEWPENIADVLPSNRIEVHINTTENPDEREITYENIKP